MSDWLDDKMEEIGRAECPECQQYIKSLGHHWRHSPECRPNMTDYQHEVVTGLLMGDGYLNRGKKNPFIVVVMTSPKYLRYLDEVVFPEFGRSVRLLRTGEENAEQLKEYGYDVGECQDIYQWYSCHLPELSIYEDWYSSGDKLWPDDIELTPATLKHWYCGDGSLRNGALSIAALNELGNEDKIDAIFNRAGLPEPSCYSGKVEWRSNHIRFTQEQSKELFEYMGEPLPDFDYKWPDRNL